MVYKFIVIYIIASFLTVLQAQPADTVEVNTKHELIFVSDSIYENSFSDVHLEIKFTGPEGSEITQSGYWDGGEIFKSMFSPPRSGMWVYQTYSSDESNSGLHNISGQFYAKNYTGENPFKKNGWLKISSNSRHLSFNDGSPFFYLGDTAWEIGWKSTSEELINYLEDRKKKGFTAIQFVPMSHQRLYEYGVRNQEGAEFFLNSDFNYLNPDYFSYIDEIVHEINSRGMVAVIVPLWAGMNRLHFDDRWRDYYLSDEQSLRIAEYMASRYAGDEVIWVVGGDNVYDTEERKKFWSEFGRTIKEASGGRQLVTVHPSGWNASFDFFSSDNDWLDFHMYQSSHIARADYTIQAAREGYNLDPVTPVLNGEAVYEDIFNRLWEPGDTTEVESSRIKPEHVRQAGYESILSGAYVGFTYGGNGIWQWHKEELPGTHFPRYEVMEALSFEGAGDMIILKEIMESHNWYDFEPGQELVLKSESRDEVEASYSNQFLVSYLATGTSSVTYQLQQDKLIDSYKFISPETGDIKMLATDVYKRSIQVQPPDTMDWVFVAQLKEKENLEEPDSFRLYQNYPNPFNPVTTIEYFLDSPSPVEFRVYDIMGRIIEKRLYGIKNKGYHIVRLDGRGWPSGIYYYMVITDNTIATNSMILTK